MIKQGIAFAWTNNELTRAHSIYGQLNGMCPFLLIAESEEQRVERIFSICSKLNKK